MQTGLIAAACRRMFPISFLHVNLPHRGHTQPPLITVLYYGCVRVMLKVILYVPTSVNFPDFPTMYRLATSARLGLGSRLPGVGVMVHAVQLSVEELAMQATVDQPVPA